MSNTYEDVLRDIYQTGELRDDRTGVGTYSKFGQMIRYNIPDGFPLITTKRVYLKGVIAELLWFLRGETNVKFLHDHNCHIWDEWADGNGDLGPIYGKQWRDWNGDGIDQIKNAINLIKNQPYSRRILVSAWNPSQLDQMALYPCHALFQFYVRGDNYLDCALYQRSADMFLGVPFNLASYSLLTMMMAQQCDLKPGEFVWIGGDCHIYKNHRAQVVEQLSRKPYPLPEMNIKKAKDIFSYDFDDFELINYRHHPTIKAPIAV